MVRHAPPAARPPESAQDRPDLRPRPLSRSLRSRSSPGRPQSADTATGTSVSTAAGGASRETDHFRSRLEPAPLRSFLPRGATSTPAAGSEEPAGERAGRQSRKAPRDRRSSISSWVEIMFGSAPAGLTLGARPVCPYHGTTSCAARQLLARRRAFPRRQSRHIGCDNKNSAPEITARER